MFITCKCLNVSIRTRDDNLKEFNRDILDNITTCDRYCDFFQQPLAIVNELDEINKVQCGLVTNEDIDLWCIHRCINCSMYTHAVHRGHEAGLILINKNMITSNDEIEKLKLHSQYSNIFKIIIDYNELYDDEKQKQLLLPLTKYSMSQLSNNIQLSLTNLQQQLEQAIQKQAAIADEKIRSFTAEQYQLLEKYRERAHIDYNILLRIICDNNNHHHHHRESLKIVTNSNLKDNNNIDDARLINKNFDHNVSIDTMDSNQSNVDDKKKIITDTVVKQKGNPIMNITKNIDNKFNIQEENFSVEHNDRYDCGEAMFALEGMDDTIKSENHDIASEIEGSDAEDSGQDEGIHIPRGQRTGHPTLAKSLPVSVPNFLTFQRPSMQESDDDQLSMDPLDPHNIRESIKALAKSVHGDTVFGDLPRPRFSTQI